MADGSPHEQKLERWRIRVRGVVQGVGFRPFVYGLATRLNLHGFVGNDSSGVFIEIEGAPSSLSQFQHALTTQPPPLAHIDNIAVAELSPRGDDAFVIVPSQAQPAAATLISPDLCICDDCLRELFDPADRRYRYPFINCTNCGPRFTIIRDIPYDRPLTTMSVFPLCPDCQREYDNPLDRRFHAQPNACPVCGPDVRLEIEDRRLAVGDEAIGRAQGMLSEGKVVAVKGLGGFHLACDATSDAAVEMLRARKGRVDKPFAVMVADMEIAARIAHMDDDERALLASRERPIVLLRKRADSPLSHLVAPGNNFIGLMLPYTPLHHLLTRSSEREARNMGRATSLGDHSALRTLHSALVMTSGNYSNEPIVKGDDEAREQLAGLADAFLLHDREIQTRCDDSVMRVFQGRELPIRRSRGYAPFPVKSPFELRPTLAVGGELKATFCLAKDEYAFMSQHIGDMENLETMQAFTRAADHMQTLFRIEPEILACDMHPGYLSTRWAREHAGDRPLISVQHHHAHIAAVMAEHGLDGSRPVIGFSFDGTGYGDDGAIWGGEMLLADYHTYQRAAHLAYIQLPGGDAAVRRPYRTALAHLAAAGVEWDDELPSVRACPPTERNVLRRQFETGFNTTPTSSMGRLFDAVASLAGVRQMVTYEAQAAIEFEALTGKSGDAESRESRRRGPQRDFEVFVENAETADGYRFDIEQDREPWRFDAAPVVRAVANDVWAGAPVAVIAGRFHNAVADLILELSIMVRDREGLQQVALSGGVFQNVTLLRLVVERLHAANFEMLTHRLVPPNDGGLALGQAVVANSMIERGKNGFA